MTEIYNTATSTNSNNILQSNTHDYQTFVSKDYMQDKLKLIMDIKENGWEILYTEKAGASACAFLIFYCRRPINYSETFIDLL